MGYNLCFYKSLHNCFYDLFTFSALAGILVWPLCALGTIFARRAGTLVNVYVAKIPSKAWKNNKRVLLCACEHEGHTECVRGLSI